MDDFIKWLISAEGAAVAGWGGLLITIFGFAITYRTARASKVAAEHALQAITKFDAMQHLTESSGILEHIITLHPLNASPGVIALYYTAVIKLLVPLNHAQDVLMEAELEILQEVIVNCKLAQEEYNKAMQDKRYALDKELLFSLLADDSQNLFKMSAIVRQRIGHDYGRQKN